MAKWSHIKEQVGQHLSSFKDVLAGLAVSVSAFLSPIIGILLLMVGFVLFDTICAIYVVKKTEGWGGFNSDRLFSVVVKFFFYLGGIVLAFAVDTQIIVSTLFGVPYLICKILAVVFIYIEFKSIDETQMVLTKKSVWTVLKEILDRGKQLKKDIGIRKEK